MRALVILGCVGLAACAQPNPPAGGGQPAAQPQAGTPVASGDIVDYGTYRTARAREGDTVATLAERIGISPSALGAYNGLPVTQTLAAGDELVIPQGG